jgi:hypothetical protein
MVVVNGFLNQDLIDIFHCSLLKCGSTIFEARVICGRLLNDTRLTTSTDLMPPYPLTWTLAITSYLLCTPYLTHSLLEPVWQLEPVVAPPSSANVSWSALVPPSHSFSPNLGSKHVCNWSSLAMIWRKIVGFRAGLVPMSMVTSQLIRQSMQDFPVGIAMRQNIFLLVCLLSLTFNDLSSFY